MRGEATSRLSTHPRRTSSSGQRPAQQCAGVGRRSRAEIKGTTVSQVSVPLRQARNLISFSVETLSATLAITQVHDVLASIDGSYDALLGYDQGAKSYYPALPPGLSDLKCLRVRHGDWIKTTKAVPLTYPLTGTCAG